MKPVLVEVKRLPEERRVRLVWSDEHAADYDYDYLRGYCPCAACQGHAPSSWTFVDVVEPKVTKIEEVGNYAVCIGWSDDHSTGIYSWEILRQLCPCGECQGEQGDEHAMVRYPEH